MLSMTYSQGREMAMHQKLSQQTGWPSIAAISTAPGTLPSFINDPLTRAREAYRAISAIKAGSLRA